MKMVLKLLFNFTVYFFKTSLQILLYWSSASDMFIVAKCQELKVTNNQPLDQFFYANSC
jgi:hypothetical protein